MAGVGGSEAGKGEEGASRVEVSVHEQETFRQTAEGSKGTRLAKWLSG